MDGALETLSTEQQEIFTHFKEISGLSDSTCLDILRACDFNLEDAVNNIIAMYSGEGENPEELVDSKDSVDANSIVRRRNNYSKHDDTVLSSEPVGSSQLFSSEKSVTVSSSTSNALPTSRSHLGSTLDLDASSSHVRVIQYPPPVSRLYFWLWPFFFSLRTLRTIFCEILSFFGLYRLATNTGFQEGGSNFISYFRQTYVTSRESDNDKGGEQRMPKFSNQKYKNAIHAARSDLKFLLVYLHKKGSVEADCFCRDILTSSEFVDFVNDSWSEMEFFGCDVDSSEGKIVSGSVRERYYPFLGLVALQQKKHFDRFMLEPTFVSHEMALVGRVEGYNRDSFESVAVATSHYVRLLRRLMKENESTLVAARVDRHNREQTKLIRQQQDLDYQESLSHDAERQKRETDRKAAEQKARDDKERLDALWVVIKEHVRSTIPNDLVMGDSETVRVRIKMPSGNILERTFDRCSSSKLLFLTVLAEEKSPRNFEIHSNFPIYHIPCEPPGLTLPLDLNIFDESWLSLDPWKLCKENDPPSFKDLKFSRHELCYVIDNDA